MIHFPGHFYESEGSQQFEGPKKKPVSLQEARDYLLRKTTELSIDEIEFYLKTYDVSPSVMDDPEIRNNVEKWIDVLTNPPPEWDFSREDVKNVVVRLRKLFPKK